MVLVLFPALNSWAPKSSLSEKQYRLLDADLEHIETSGENYLRPSNLHLSNPIAEL